METQSSLMQLFMRLGLNSSGPDGASGGLMSLDGEGFNSVYDEIIQGLPGNQALSDDGALSALSALPEGMAAEAELSQFAESAAPEISPAQLQTLPMGGQVLPLDDLDPALAIKPESLRSEGLDKERQDKLAPLLQAMRAGQSGAEDNNVLATDDSGMIADDSAIEYRQQMVSSIFQSAGQLNNQLIQSPQLNHAQASSQISAQINSQGRPDLRSQLNANINGGNTQAMDAEQVGDNPDADRFLGADGLQTSVSNNAAPKPMQDLAAQLNPQQGQNTQAAAPAAQLTSAEAQLANQEAEGLLEDDMQQFNELEQQRELKADVEKSLQLNKGQQAWGDAISERITMAAAKDVQKATIHLDPPELGALELKLEVNEDRQTQVQVQVQNPQVKEALESSAVRLREMLEKEGLQLANLDVSDQSQQQGQSQDQSEQNGDGFLTESEVDEIEQGTVVKTSDSLLDTYV